MQLHHKPESLVACLLPGGFNTFMGNRQRLFAQDLAQSFSSYAGAQERGLVCHGLLIPEVQSESEDPG